jgi:hypothetical protein
MPTARIRRLGTSGGKFNSHGLARFILRTGCYTSLMGMKTDRNLMEFARSNLSVEQIANS